MKMDCRVGAGAACICLCLSGCNAPQQAMPYTLTASFQEAEFKPYAAPGPAQIAGQAFLKTVGGDVKTCAGNRVSLVPATSYNAEALQHASAQLSNPDERVKSFTKSTICDAEGRFEIDRLAARKWYVVTNVSWGVPQVEDGMFGPIVVTDQQGGFLMQQIDLKPGKNSIILTDADRIR